MHGANSLEANEREQNSESQPVNNLRTVRNERIVQPYQSQKLGLFNCPLWLRELDNGDNKVIGHSSIMAAQDHQRERSFKTRFSSKRPSAGRRIRGLAHRSAPKIRFAVSGNPAVGKRY